MNYKDFLQYINEWDIEVYREWPDGWIKSLWSHELPAGIVRIYIGSFSDGKRKSAYYVEPEVLRKILMYELKKSQEALRESSELCCIDEDVSELYFADYARHNSNVCVMLSLLFGYDVRDIEMNHSLYWDLLDLVSQEL